MLFHFPSSFFLNEEMKLETTSLPSGFFSGCCSHSRRDGSHWNRRLCRSDHSCFQFFKNSFLEISQLSVSSSQSKTDWRPNLVSDSLKFKTPETIWMGMWVHLTTCCCPPLLVPLHEFFRFIRQVFLVSTHFLININITWHWDIPTVRYQAVGHELHTFGWW